MSSRSWPCLLDWEKGHARSDAARIERYTRWPSALRPGRRARTFSSAIARCSAKNVARLPGCEAPLSTRSAMGLSFGLYSGTRTIHNPDGTSNTSDTFAKRCHTITCGAVSSVAGFHIRLTGLHRTWAGLSGLRSSTVCKAAPAKRPCAQSVSGGPYCSSSRGAIAMSERA